MRRWRLPMPAVTNWPRARANLLLALIDEPDAARDDEACSWTSTKLRSSPEEFIEDDLAPS